MQSNPAIPAVNSGMRIMPNSWELASGEQANAIEVFNGRRCYDKINQLLERAIQEDGRSEIGSTNRPPLFPDVKAIHAVLTKDLMPDAGQVRTTHVQVKYSDTGLVAFDPPRPVEVPDLLDDFDDTMAKLWSEPRNLPWVIRVSAYVLWRLNFIHPFRNGNGRTARFASYTAICFARGAMLRGERTVPDLITTRRRAYERGLVLASNAVRATGLADLSLMQSLLSDVLAEQLSVGAGCESLPVV